MPTRCRTYEKWATMPDGRSVQLPWCVEHGRWFMECQCRVLAADKRVLPRAEVVDLALERAKRRQ